MNLQDIRTFFGEQKWIFAKTYAERAPHEYCLRKNVPGREREFAEAARLIRETGFRAKFWGHPNTYLYLDGHLYWTMDPTPEATDLINRSDLRDYDLLIRAKRPEERERSSSDIGECG